MKSGAIHVHIGRLVVDKGFDRAGFERALARSFSQAARGDWTSSAVDHLRVDVGAKDTSAPSAAEGVVECVRLLACAPLAGIEKGRHGGK